MSQSEPNPTNEQTSNDPYRENPLVVGTKSSASSPNTPSTNQQPVQNPSKTELVSDFSSLGVGIDTTDSLEATNKALSPEKETESLTKETSFIAQDLEKALIEKPSDRNENHDELKREAIMHTPTSDSPEEEKAIDNPLPKEENQVFETEVTSTPAPEEDQPPQINYSDSLPKIRTFEGDAANVLRTQKSSKAHIAVAEATKKNQGRIQAGSDSSNNKSVINILLIGVLMLFTLGLLAYATFLRPEGPLPGNSITVNELMFVENRHEVALESAIAAQLGSILQESLIQTQVPVNQIHNLYITQGTGSNKHVIPVEDFMRLIAAEAPASLARTFNQFMYGLHGRNNEKEPFIVFKISSFDTAFAGMLRWESTMARDLGFMINTLSNEETIEERIIVESEMEDSELAEEELERSEEENINDMIERVEIFPSVGNIWQDRVIENRDVRYLSGTQGIQLMYSFPDRNTIVITTNEDTFKEIISRLNLARFSPQN
jgi:hypothetical protein